MSSLNEAARTTLRNAGVSISAWEQHNHYEPGGWGGDACGCPDDRCIGYHHDAQDECGCLEALLSAVSTQGGQ